MVRSPPKNALFILLLLVTTSLATGCNNRKPKVTTGYGRTSGLGFGNSVNGTSVFVQMLRMRGGKVDKASSISPRIEKYDQIVWFTQRFQAPRVEVVTALNEWLERKTGRQLIYVARDHDSGIDYWEEVTKRAQGSELIEARRKLARVKAEFHSLRSTKDLELDSCEWFTLKKNDYQRAKKFGGQWAGRFDANKADVKVGRMLKPITIQPQLYRSGSNGRGRRDGKSSQVLLSADSQPLVSSIESYGDNEILIVSNASFLTNYALVNVENRRIANTLINRKSYVQKTLVLETGPLPAQIRTYDDSHQTWAWITKPPLKYMVPHFLMLGVFFCFVLFPIFGRPKRWNSGEENTTFRSHVKAMGKLMSRSKSIDFAEQNLAKYANRNWKEEK